MPGKPALGKGRSCLVFDGRWQMIRVLSRLEIATSSLGELLDGQGAVKFRLQRGLSLQVRGGRGSSDSAGERVGVSVLGHLSARMPASPLLL